MTPEFPRIQVFVAEVNDVKRRRQEEYDYLKQDNLLTPLRKAATLLQQAYPDARLNVANPNTPSVRASVDIHLQWGFFVNRPVDPLDSITMIEWNEVELAANRDIDGQINGVRFNGHNRIVNPQDSSIVALALDLFVANPLTKERRLTKYGDPRNDNTREGISTVVPTSHPMWENRDPVIVPPRRSRLAAIVDNMEPISESTERLQDLTQSSYLPGSDRLSRSVYIPGQGYRIGKKDFDGTVRGMKLADIAKVRPVLRQWLRDEQGNVLSDEVAYTLEAMRQSVEGQNERKYLVAESRKKTIIGVVGMKHPEDQMSTYTETSQPAELINAYVRADYRKGSGIGKILVRTLERQLMQQGYTELILNSGPRYQYTGWGFYDRLSGYRRVGIAKNMYGENVDAPVWRKSFTVPAVINA